MLNRYLKLRLRPLIVFIIKTYVYSLRCLPLNSKKVVAMSGACDRFDDNPKFILDHIHRLYPESELVWMKNAKSTYELPSWVRVVRWKSLHCFFEFATAKVWIANGIIDYIPKRNNQLYIETWHGGLGIKRIGVDAVGLTVKGSQHKRWDKCYADVFISNSDHLSSIYRRAFKYRGPIWKVGYPKNDQLLFDQAKTKERIKRELGISAGTKLILYAPTWRESTYDREHCFNKSYDLDLYRLQKNVQDRFGGAWKVAVRFHPRLRGLVEKYHEEHPDFINATYYPNMQDLLSAVDILVSDYSSCIFDVALRGIPCFTYASDFEYYKNDERGVYYEMEELPFPYATNNDEMERNVKTFCELDYLKSWDAFSARVGLVETGHAGEDVAKKVIEYLKGKTIHWPNDYCVKEIKR